MSVVGIDIGHNNCKLAFYDGSSVRLVSQRMPENLVKDDGEVAAPELMGQFLKQFKSSERVKGKDCSLVLGPEQAFFRHVTLPDMTESELLLNLPYEFRDYIIDDPDSYVYDYAIDELVRDESGKVIRMELYAAAASKEIINDYSTVLKKAGLKLKYVIPTQMAYSCLLHHHALEHPEHADRDVVLVDIGHSDLVVSLFHGSKFDSARTVDFGCDELDQIIANLKDIDPYTAEAYKFNNFENVLDEPECLALCERFGLEVSKVVNFYNFNNPEREIEQLYFIGGGALIPQLTDAITEAVSVPAAHASELVPSYAASNQEVASCAVALAGLLESEVL